MKRWLDWLTWPEGLRLGVGGVLGCVGGAALFVFFAQGNWGSDLAGPVMAFGAGLVAVAVAMILAARLTRRGQMIASGLGTVLLTIAGTEIPEMLADPAVVRHIPEAVLILFFIVGPLLLAAVTLYRRWRDLEADWPASRVATSSSGNTQGEQAVSGVKDAWRIGGRRDMAVVAGILIVLTGGISLAVYPDLNRAYMEMQQPTEAELASLYQQKWQAREGYAGDLSNAFGSVGGLPTLSAPWERRTITTFNKEHCASYGVAYSCSVVVAFSRGLPERHAMVVRRADEGWELESLE